jgi:epoxyqueuosine reductase
VSDYADLVRHWIAEGRHGEMAYLENHLDTRLDPGKLLEGARSILCVADLHPKSTDLPPHGPAPHGRIARYAFGDDYHKTIKKRLHQLADALAAEHPGEKFRSTVDTAPILEREHAARAGLGWVGKHTLLIHPRLGSYMLLGTIITTMDLTDTATTDPADVLPPIDHCGTCTRCIDACPTNCISASDPRSVDATRCISYLTLEHRSPIDPGLHTMMGDWIAGCDVCQEVCPFNGGVRGSGFGDQDNQTYQPAYTPRPPAPAVSLSEVLDWSEDDRRAAFKGSALKRIKLDMLKRNALIAAGNTLTAGEDKALRGQIKRLADEAEQSEMVRLTARQVLERLGQGSAPGDP